jgi:hypothetical protein
VYREGRPGRFRYRLAGKGRRWKRKADAELPRAKELVEEIVAHQRAMGWIPASEPEPTPEPRRSTERPQQWPPPVERRVPEPPPEVRRVRTKLIQWEIEHGLRAPDGRPWPTEE